MSITTLLQVVEDRDRHLANYFMLQEKDSNANFA